MSTLATMDWCEDNYGVSPYVAEFWNMVSSLFITVCAAEGFLDWASLNFRLGKNTFLPCWASLNARLGGHL